MTLRRRAAIVLVSATATLGLTAGTAQAEFATQNGNLAVAVPTTPSTSQSGSFDLKFPVGVVTRSGQHCAPHPFAGRGARLPSQGYPVWLSR